MQIKFNSLAALTVAEVGENNVQGYLYGSFNRDSQTLTITNSIVTPETIADDFLTTTKLALAAGNLDCTKVGHFISGDNFNLESFIEESVKTQNEAIPEFIFCIFDTTLAPFSFKDAFQCFRFTQEFCDAFKKGKSSLAMASMPASNVLEKIPVEIELTHLEEYIIAEEGAYPGRVNIPVTVKSLTRNLEDYKKNCRARQEPNRSDYFKLVCTELAINFDIEKAELIYH